tara:strand:- start:7447 stop:7893 length:447 start_codon:yes stop_codon:yes gene_type:complete
MGANSNLFLMLQEQQVETNNFLPTKKEIQLSAKTFVKNTLEAGEVSEMELYTQALRINEALEIVTAELKNSIPQENFEAFGVKGTYRSGGETINYKEDEIWRLLNEQIKKREAMLKLAVQNGEEYTIDGVYVPLVSTTPRKSSLAISF